MKRFRLAALASRLFVLGTAVVLSTADAQATLIYTSGPIGGTQPTHPVSQSYAVTESFTVAGSSTLASATAGLWTAGSDVPLTINWSIGTSPFGSEISSGTGAALTNVFHNIASNYGYFVYASSFNLTGSLTAGTYYLTLTGGTYSGLQGAGMFWDANGGTSSGYWGEYGFNLGPVGSASFSLYGTPLNASPEPSAFALMAGSLTPLLGFRAWGRRNRKGTTPA